MTEMEEQPKLDNTDKDQCPVTQPEHEPDQESDSVNDDRARVSVSESTSKPSEPHPKPSLLSKQPESPDQIEANTTIESEDSSGEQFEVVRLSSLTKKEEEPCKETEEGVATPPQAEGDNGKELQIETKEPTREHEAYDEEDPAPQAEREDKETIAPTQAEEAGADSGRTTPKDEDVVLETDKEAELERDDTGKQEVWSKGEQQVNEDASEKPGVAPIEAVGDDNDTTVGEVNAAEREKEESDEKMEVETFPVAADRADEDADDADSGGASSEQQREEGGVEEDTPEMETEKKIDAATIKPLETESLGEAGSGDAVVQTTDATAAPMEEDIQKEADEPLETKMETECATDEHTESTESEYARKNETVSKQSMPPEAEMETENVTATEHVSTSEADVGTGNVTIVPSNVGPVKEAATTTEASKQHEATEPEVDDSKFESTSLSPLEDNPVEPESAKDNENSTDMTPSPTSHDEEGGEDKDDDEQGLPLVQLGGATSEAPTEQTTDEGSVHEQEQSTIAVEGTTSAGDTETTLAEPAEEKQDSERQELAETVEVGDNPEKVESDIEHPEELTQPGVVEQNDKAETAKLESSFESFEPETLPSKESVEHVSTGTEKNEIDKGPEEAMDEETVASVSTDDQRQADEGKDESAMGTRESETPPDKMEIADSSVGREKAIPDTQGESPTSQESQATESTVVIDQTSKEQEISDPVEIAQDISDKTQEAADEDQKVTSSSPVQSEASDCKEATSDDSSKQPLPSTQAPPTSTSAPPTSTVAPPTSTAAPPTSTFALPTSSSAPASSTSTSATASPTSVGASLGAGFNVDTTSASTVSTSAGAVSVSSTSTSVAAPASTVSISTSTSSVSATSASAGTVLSISPPATVVSGDQPHLVIAAPQTNKDAVTCTVKTTVTVSAPPILAPPTSKTPPTSSSSQTPCQAPPTTTPTSTEPPSVVSPTTTLSSSKVPSQAPPTTTPTSIGTPSIPPPTTTPTSSSFKVPSLTNVPSLSLLTSRSSTLPHTMPSFGATPSQAVVSKPSSAPMQSTSVIGAKLPSFDTPQSVSSVPTTATAVSKASATSAAMSISMTHTTATAQIGTARMAKLPSFSSVFTSAPSGVPNTTVANLPLFSKLTTSAISVTTPVASAVPTSRVQPVPSNIPSSVANPPKTAEASIVSASAPKPPGGVSTLVSGGVPTPISVAQLPAPSTAAVSTATPAMTSSSSITNLTNSSTSPSSTTFTSPSPSSTTTTHKDSQQQPPAATKPHTNTISVITQLPASFTAAPKTASSVSGAAVVAGGGHYSVVLGVGPGHQREQNIIVGMHGAERLKVGEAEILQVSGESDLRLQQQKIEVKSREEMMGKVPPQVAVIPPIIDLTRTPEYSQVEKLKGQGMVAGDVGKGKSSSVFMGVGGGGSSEGYQRRHSGEMKSVEKTTGVVMAGQEFKSHIGELKASSHPVARRIWMSSCRPLDPASLERIGVDSKGTVYWYDGGKNMFQSPPSNDPAYKPSESELQLSCKSMVQWTAKLKDLRHSNIEADMKLAQSIKDQFLSRVRIATQRKPRDMSVIQKLQAVHSLRPTQLSPQQQQQQQQQQASASAKPTITLTTSQAAAAAAAAGAGGTVAIAAGSGGGDGIATQKTAQIVQGSFPQGSILVVPHPTHPFHAVLPVFANTAMLMPQAAVATTTAGATGAIVGAAPTSTVTVSQSSTNNKKVASASDGESTKVPSSVSATAQTILVQAPVTSQSLAALQASPSTVIQLSGSRNNVPGVSTSEKTKESAAIATKERSTPSKQPSSEMHVQQQTQKGIALSSSPQTATISIHPSFLPQALASGMITALPGGGVKFQDYRQALALSAMVQVMPVKVGEPVKLSTINFESKSIEISGEVPIKKVEVDKETGELIPVPVTAEPSEQEQQQQKGVVVESERTSSKEGEKSSKAKKHKANEEEGHVDVEGESRHGQVSDDKTVKSLLAKETREGGEGAFSGHSSSDIMSAQLLLSLTDPTHKDWSAVAAPVPAATQPTTTDKTADSAVKSVLTKEASIVLTPVSLKSSGRDETASPASSITSQHTTASGGRKRKQKPIASAKPDDESMTTTPTPKGRKGGRKAKQGAVGGEGGEGKTSTAKKKTANDKIAVGNKETPGRSKQLSPEELLILLDIPPSSSSTGKGSSKNKTPTTKAKGKGKDKSNQDGRSVLQSSNATAKMEELKASRADKPMKEYVIETDSDSADSSSSGTSSSRFSPDSGSSSDSSSDSSSEEGGGGGGEGSEAKVKPPPKKIPARSSKGGVARGRGGRGRGGRAQRKGKKAESSSAESSSEDEEEVESKKEPARARGGGGRARGGRGGRGQRGTGRQETKQQEKGQHGHIVSIPTNLLSHKPATGKKRKAVGKVTEAEKAATADYIPDLPVDLATLYATKGGVDLGTLSELTKSVNDDGLDIDIGIVGGGSRSKRTCVRMREEITKLQEILKDNGAPEVKPSPPARAKTTSMKASMKARSSSGRTSDVSGQESVTVASSSLAPVKKYRRPAYSQFTHKRRKRRRKQPEEEALWQPASRKGGSGESYKPVYLFSTFLANKAATAVETSRYNSIIQFHQAQPKDPGFLRLPPAERQTKPPRGSISDRKQTDADSGEEEMSAKETKSTPRGQKRRNSGRTSEGSTTRRSRNSEVESADKVPSPQPFLRSSRRLRQQRNRSNASPPPLQSPSSPDGPRSPLPPSPPSGVRPRPRKISQTAAGGSGSAVQQRSLRRKRNNQQQEESPTSPVPDLFEAKRSQQVEEMDSPSDDEDRMKEDEMSDGEFGARKKARLDEGEADKNVLSSPGMQSPEQQRSIPPPNSREEENYTICHGTPVNKSVTSDISSPKNWPSSAHHPSQQQQQQQQQMQNQQQIQRMQAQYSHHHHHSQQQQQMHAHQQQMQQYAAATQAAGHAAAQHQHRAPSTPSSEAVTFSPPMLHPGSSSSPVGGSGFDHRSVAAAGGIAAPGGGAGHNSGGGRDGSGSGGGGRGSIQAAEYAHRHHQLMSAAEHAHLRESNSSWAAAAAGLHPHQFPSVPGAYPGAYPPMYNPAGIPGMHYSGQPMAGANYPYPMPYHWGHHHPSVAGAAAASVPQFGEHMLQQQQHHHQQQQQAQQQHRQAATSKDVQSHHDVLQHPHISGHTAESPQSSSLHLRGSSSAQSVNVTSSMTAAAGKPSSRGHYPSPQAAALHQLASPVSAAASHTLSHQVPHGAEHLPPGAHQAAAAAATFPYGFDSSAHSLSHMHMLQQSQMQPQLTRPLHGVPPHHLPPHMASRGLWYSPQHMAAHQMMAGGGAEIPGHPAAHSKKATSKSSKSATPVDGDKNRNVNNNNNVQQVNISGAPTNQRVGSTQEFISANAYKSPAMTYPSGAHNSSSSSITPGATFSVENLAAPYNTAHLVGVSATPQTPPPHQGQRFGSNPGGGSLPAVSVILEQTRKQE